MKIRYTHTTSTCGNQGRELTMNVNRLSRKDRSKVRFFRPEHFPVPQGAWKNDDADPRACEGWVFFYARF
jgi:hypothetical protein